MCNIYLISSIFISSKIKILLGNLDEITNTKTKQVLAEYTYRWSRNGLKSEIGSLKQNLLILPKMAEFIEGWRSTECTYTQL